MSSHYFSKRVPERTKVRNKANRPKTFKTEESAKAWAEKQGIKKYSLHNRRSPESKTKKLRVIAE